MTFEMMTSQRGKPLILLEGHKYSMHRVLTTTTETVWRCIQKKCTAKVYTLGKASDSTFSKKSGNHQHGPESESNLNRQRIGNAVKRKVDDLLCDTPSKVVHRELDLQPGVLETLSKRDMR